MSSRPSSSAVRSTAATRLLAIGDVGLDRQAADLGRQRIQAVLAARGDGDRRALVGERARRRLADPAARARDERDRTLQFVAHAADVYPFANSWIDAGSPGVGTNGSPAASALLGPSGTASNRPRSTR